MNIIEYENYQEKIDHDVVGFPYVTYPCSIPLDFPKVPLHWHDEMEIIYIKKGQGVVTVDEVTYHVNGGDIVVILPGRLHSISQEPECSMEYENIIFQPSMLMARQNDNTMTEYVQPLFQSQFDIPEYLSPSWTAYEDAAHCLNEADRLCETHPFAYQISVKAHLLQFFYILLSNMDDCTIKVPHNQRSLGKKKLILKHIETHYAEKLTIEEMAEVCDFSQSHFMKFFKSTFGVSFVTYLKEYRLTMASRLLLSSESSILDIAERTGFDNLSYFNRSFKAMYGKTPREFRGKG